MLESREDGDAAMRSLYAVVKMRRRRWPETCRAACGDVAAAAADASRVDQTRGEGGGWRVVVMVVVVWWWVNVKTRGEKEKARVSM